MVGGLSVIITGVVVIVVAQILVRFLVEPLQEFHKVRGRIANALSRHFSTGAVFTDEDGDIHRDDPEDLQRIADDINAMSADLRAGAAIIPFYPLVARVFRLPTRQALKGATGALHLWAREMQFGYGYTSDYMDKIDSALKLHVMWYYDQTGAPDPLERRPKTRKKVARALAHAATAKA